MRAVPKSFVMPIRILLVALVYFASGKLSLLLAIPPGYATAIFLPVGIGMGAALIWGLPTVAGVFLGSAVLNVVTGTPDVTLASVAVALEIAAGSALAVTTGTLLIRRVIGFPNPLTSERHIFLFLLLGGPVAAIVSASVGVTALWANKVISVNYVQYSWLIWWIGDALGVLIATPVMCALFARPRSMWRNRLRIAGIPVLISCLIVVFAYVRTSHNEQNKLESALHQQAKLLVIEFDNGLKSSIQTLMSLRALFMAADTVSREDFATFVRNIDIEQQGMSAISWNRYVTHAERAAFEAQMRATGLENFQITEKPDAIHFVPAAQRDAYVVVTYVEPLQSNRIVLGFDAASQPSRNQILQRAIATNEPSMTRPISLAQDQSLSTLIFLPVYRPAPKATGATDTGAAQKKRPPLGFATAVMRIDTMIQTVFQHFDYDLYRLQILDITDPQQPLTFYSDNLNNIPANARPLAWSDSLSVAGRTLKITVFPTQTFIRRNSGNGAWFVLAAGLLFSSLLGAFLLLISGRTQHVRDLVENQTKEIASILENAVEAILVVDTRGAILRANPAAAKLFCYTHKELMTLYIYELIPPLLENYLQAEKPLPTGKSIETTAVNRYQSDIAIEMSSSQLDLHDRQLFTFIIHDISERQKVDRLKAEFISTVSHELRTPLTSIKGSLGILQSGALGKFNEEVQNLLNIAGNNADRLNRLVNDILDIDKLEFGKLQLNLVCRPVYPLLLQATEQNQGYASKYNVRLELQDMAVGSEMLYANIDSDRFLQVMSNLISNAIKFSPTEATVSVTLEADTEHLTVSVIDHGDGIPAKFHKQIFQKFAQADSSDRRKHEGTGLGLSISKVIVERFGGTIGFTSIPQEETRFYFSLPRADIN